MAAADDIGGSAGVEAAAAVDEGAVLDHAAGRAEAAIGYRFKDPSLLSLALRHSSHSDSRVESNERLEFLGDAVLGLVVCERIYARFPDLLEGEMTKIKSAAVSRRACADIAEKLGLDEILVLGKGMQGQQSLPRSLAAGVLESVAGAVFEDGGLEAARAFLGPLVDEHIERAAESGHQNNWKSVLQQHAQQELASTPDYVVVDERGPDHAKTFRISVELAGRRYDPGRGMSKKQAEQAAALNALRALGAVTS